jgi:hypothetical protein
MADTELNRLKAQYFMSAAYHEAGHTTAAVLQQMPLQERGILVYQEASGVSYYCHRVPGDLANSRKDQSERERTITALYAGTIAQARFFPDCPESDWASDKATICALLKEMHPADLAARSVTQDKLRENAEQLVSKNWPIIECLASTLLAKSDMLLPTIEIEGKASQDSKRIGKWMRGSEVAEFFGRLQIATSIRRAEAERRDEIR